MDRCYSVLNIRAVDDDARVIRGVASTPDPDRMGDIVEPLGLKFKNPVPLLWQHDHDSPVGTVRFDKPTKDGVTFEARLPKITEPGRLKDRVDDAWQSVKAGVVRAVSIGFRALESSRMENGGLRFLQSELLELSLVSVPANAGATITEIKSIDRRLRAASGNAQSVVRKTPAAAGSLNSSTKEKDMEDINDQVAALEARRAELVAEMKSFGDVTDLDDEQSAEYDEVSAAFDEVEKKLGRARRLAKAVGSVREIDGSTREKAAASRGRQVTVPAEVKKELPKGERFTRLVISKMVETATGMKAANYAKERFGDTPEVASVLKAGEVGSTVLASPGWGSELVEQRNIEGEFIDLLRDATVVDKLQGLYLTEFNSSRPAMVGGATAAWVGEGAPKPITGPEFTNVTLGYHKLAGIVPFTVELERFARPNIVQIVQRDLVASIASVIDNSFLDHTYGPATSAHPEAVTYNVTGNQATGSDADAFLYDLNVALAGFDAVNLDLSTLSIVTTPAIARGLSTLTTLTGGPAFPNMSPGGGSILGIPVLVSNAVTSGDVILVVAGEILFADDGVSRVAVSREASLDLSGSTSATYSLFQNNAVAVLVERAVSWGHRRPGLKAVNRIHTAAYGPTSDASPA